jgi:hypothetical protein
MAEATVSDKFAQVRGFRVEISGATGSDVDTAWESLSSGAQIGTDKFKTNAPGHKSVDTITLRGAMTDGRKALCQWIQATVDGKDWRRTVTVSGFLVDDNANPIPERYVFHDCFPVRYVFPPLETGGVELDEEVTFAYGSFEVLAK